MARKDFPSKNGKWRIIVEGDPTDAHIRCTGLVPKDVKLSVARKEESGSSKSHLMSVQSVRALSPLRVDMA